MIGLWATERLDSGRLDSGRLDSGPLDAWILDAWTLNNWMLGHLDSERLDSEQLDVGFWIPGLLTLGSRKFYPFSVTFLSFLLLFTVEFFSISNAL